MPAHPCFLLKDSLLSRDIDNIQLHIKIWGENNSTCHTVAYQLVLSLMILNYEEKAGCCISWSYILLSFIQAAQRQLIPNLLSSHC